MIAYIEGKVAGINPAHVIIDTGGLAYELQISLYTFEKIKEKSQCRLFTHLAIKEDSHTLFGFFDERERQMFRSLIGVSGVGTSTARMILSSLTVDELEHAILSGNSALIKTVKGVGPKSSQKIVIELQDRLGKLQPATGGIAVSGNPGGRMQAVDALVMLGFGRSEADKAVNKIIGAQNETLSIEEIIKLALKIL